VTIVRGQRALRFPTSFMLLAATNPCPCGYAGIGERCGCSESDLRRHRRRLSGPLLDRMDLLVAVDRPGARELRAPPATTSAAAALRVAEARARQAARLRGEGVSANGEMDTRQVSRYVTLAEPAARTLEQGYASGALSARGRHRILRVAQTIADLRGHDHVKEPDLLLALGLRQRGAREPAAWAA
jgi:magnesium chelatase family protein